MFELVLELTVEQSDSGIVECLEFPHRIRSIAFGHIFRKANKTTRAGIVGGKSIAVNIPITLKCMVRRRTAMGLNLGEGTVRVNVSGLFVENLSPGT